MAEHRIVCIGTGEKLTSPRPIRMDSRGYRYAKPGKIYWYGGDETHHQETDLKDAPLVSAYPGGPLVQGWGLVVVSDTNTNILKTPTEANGVTEPKEWETRIIKAKERALGLLNFWAVPNPPHVDYGAILIAGEMPTEAELRQARGNRERNAHARLNAAINDQNLGRNGHRPRKRGYSHSDRAWAAEYGIVLPETVDSMDRVAVDEMRVECPECAELIKPAARLCIHCNTKFKMPVVEYRNRPVEAVAAAAR